MTPAPKRTTSRRSGHERAVLAAWVVLALAAAAALAVGARPVGAPLSPAQRAAQIDGAVRCPSCAGLSAAQSNASTAVAIRQIVRKRVDEGQSASAIESFLVSRYGESILLTPPSGGVDILVWLLPILGGIAALAGFGIVFVRRSRAGFTPEVTDDERAAVEGALAAASAAAAATASAADAAASASSSQAASPSPAGDG